MSPPFLGMGGYPLPVRRCFSGSDSDALRKKCNLNPNTPQVSEPIKAHSSLESHPRR
jgi:hypothetical protein